MPWIASSGPAGRTSQAFARASRAGRAIRTAPPVRSRRAGGPLVRRPGTSPHSRGVGNILPGLRQAGRVEGAAHQLHGVEVLLGEHPRHVLGLVHAHAVLAGDRPAVLDAQVEDRAETLSAARPRPRPRRRTAPAGAGCRRPRGRRWPRGRRRAGRARRCAASTSGSGRTGDDAVLDDVVGADPARPRRTRTCGPSRSAPARRRRRRPGSRRRRSPRRAARPARTARRPRPAGRPARSRAPPPAPSG